jgi:hypothetical protein
MPLKCALCNFTGQLDGGDKIEASIPINSYENPRQLCFAINQTMTSKTLTKKKPRVGDKSTDDWDTEEEIRSKPNAIFTYDETQRLVAFKSDGIPNFKGIKVSPRLQYMLGYSSPQIFFEGEGSTSIVYTRNGNTVALVNIPAHGPPDLNAGFNLLYIYCDLVEQQIVGNTLSPLLDVVSAEGTFSEMTRVDILDPHYVPVLRKDFESIEIAIRDDAGQPVNFKYGRVLVKLHFRRPRYL